ncbi:MAG: sigma-70 family RNA polymerase sigma factor [Chitinophagaceae bacterium]|nr:sigma-70 family RNA polymerase sigma factor [Chitinophagaceae bacterium]
MPYYRAKVYRFILQFVKNTNLADDLTQDVMMKVWNRYEQLSVVTDVDNYILKMAKNHVIDHFKKLAREKTYQEEVWYHLQKTENRTESKLVQQDIDAHLEAVIKSLPTRQQEVYTLNKREGLSLPQIAETLGITVRTARNHLDRALKVIRNQMNSDSFWLWVMGVVGCITL